MKRKLVEGKLLICRTFGRLRSTVKLPMKPNLREEAWWKLDITQGLKDKHFHFLMGQKWIYPRIKHEFWFVCWQYLNNISSNFSKSYCHCGSHFQLFIYLLLYGHSPKSKLSCLIKMHISAQLVMGGIKLNSLHLSPVAVIGDLEMDQLD